MNTHKHSKNMGCGAFTAHSFPVLLPTWTGDTGAHFKLGTGTRPKRVIIPIPVSRCRARPRWISGEAPQTHGLASGDGLIIGARGLYKHQAGLGQKQPPCGYGCHMGPQAPSLSLSSPPSLSLCLSLSLSPSVSLSLSLFGLFVFQPAAVSVSPAFHLPDGWSSGKQVKERERERETES